MKALLLALALLCITIPTSTAATSKTVDVTFDEVLIPSTFDDKERVVFAVSGHYPNTCYGLGPHALKVDEIEKIIFVQQRAYVAEGECAEMLVPYANIIEVGLLPAGEYSIVDHKTGKRFNTLLVAVNKPQEREKFAPVSDAYLAFDETLKVNKLVLTGEFKDRCMEIEEVKVHYEDKVLSVEPILKKIRCELEGPARYTEDIDLRRGLKGLYLLHVRSAEERSFNRLVEVK